MIRCWNRFRCAVRKCTRINRSGKRGVRTGWAHRKFEAELQEIAQTISGYVTENRTYEEKIAALQQTIAKKNEQLRIGQTAFHREQSRLESLKNITERYDGYGNSIRKVMEKKEQEKGLLGVVADLIKVDKAYEIAVETALGGSIQNIVTDNEETAKRMITFLKQNKFGRATFLSADEYQWNCRYSAKRGSSRGGGDRACEYTCQGGRNIQGACRTSVGKNSCCKAYWPRGGAGKKI